MRIVLALAAALLAVCAQAQTLYAVSVRTFSDPGYSGSEGSLYTVDPSTAALNLVAALHLGTVPIGLDGIAIHPDTGIFYGITAPTSKVAPASLVIVDAKTGDMRLVGPLGHPVSDMSFDDQGTLFAWLTDLGQLGVVNLETGAVAPLGQASKRRSGIKAGIAMVGNGRALVASTGATGTLDSIDLASGRITSGPTLTGAPFPDMVNGLAYSPEGVLYGVNTGFAANSAVDLVKIDARSGQVTRIGPLPTGTDALVFRPHEARSGTLDFVRKQWRMLVLGTLFVIAVALVVVAIRRGGHAR